MSLCGISRRRLIAGTVAAAALSQVSAESLSIASAGREAVVYQTTSLTAEGLVAALRSVQSTLKGRVAVKLHTGEPHGPNILPREWVKALINELPDAVIVETNTLYGGPRAAGRGLQRPDIVKRSLRTAGPSRPLTSWMKTAERHGRLRAAVGSSP